MILKEKAKIMNKEAMDKTLTRIACEIIEHNKNVNDLAIVGIRNRGEHLARRIVAIIEKKQKEKIAFGVLDITLYRDDLTALAQQPIVHETCIDFDVTAKHIVLVDDVLYTGRTIRCALDEIIDFGRPKSIQLAVLIDRGHRELPIRPDYIGKNIPTSDKEMVDARVEEFDTKDEVILVEKIND
ncbi:MAG: bifunctional pyr operon transcriptional regulator/uracil phosphoribosyltransferase PyrR [Candidatus Omnitrophota bacterium]|nr:MAG: bifunctional pyr operon transcriptional regulator/uracil phosphoribosyltransferase PyrR [Candidatus Omnitrophota bacterium]